MKKWLLLFITIFMLSSTGATACSCVQAKASLSKKVKASYRTTDAVFTGKVISKKIVQSDPNIQLSSDSVTYVFEIEKSFKSTPAVKRLEVTSYRDGSFCGFEFETGKSYLVYARMYDNALFTDLCTRTRSIKNIEKRELRMLRRQHCKSQSKSKYHG